MILIFLLQLYLVAQIFSQDYKKIIGYDFHSQEILAIADVTKDIGQNTVSQQIIASGGYEIGLIVLKKVFQNEKERKINFINYQQQITHILKVPSSPHMLVFLKNKVALINAEQLYNSATTYPYNDNSLYSEIEVSSDFRSNVPSIAYVQNSVSSIDYMAAFTNTQGVVFFTFSQNNGLLSPLTYKSVCYLPLNIQTLSVIYMNNVGFIGVMGLASGTLSLYNIETKQVQREISLFTLQIQAISTISNGSSFLATVADINGLIKVVEIPGVQNVFGLLTAELKVIKAFTNFQGSSQAVTKFSNIIGTNYMLISGFSHQISIQDAQNGEFLAQYSFNSISNMVGNAQDYIRGTGYVVVKEFDTSVFQFQNKYVLLPVCKNDYILDLSQNSCISSDSISKEEVGPNLIVNKCDSWSYFNGKVCVSCPAECTKCTASRVWDYQTSTMVQCKTCDALGKCQCQQPTLGCTGSQYWSQKDCKCQSCDEFNVTCLTGKLLDKTTCQCKDISLLGCSSNDKCAKCENTVCSKCTNVSLSPPECLCSIGLYWNSSTRECQKCAQQDCKQCTGSNGETCLQIIQTRELKLAYPAQIVIGVAVLYSLTLAGVYGLKIFKKMQSQTTNGFGNKNKISVKVHNSESYNLNDRNANPEDSANDHLFNNPTINNQPNGVNDSVLAQQNNNNQIPSNRNNRPRKLVPMNRVPSPRYNFD